MRLEREKPSGFFSSRASSRARGKKEESVMGLGHCFLTEDAEEEIRIAVDRAGRTGMPNLAVYERDVIRYSGALARGEGTTFVTRAHVRNVTEQYEDLKALEKGSYGGEITEIAI